MIKIFTATYNGRISFFLCQSTGFKILEKMKNEEERDEDGDCGCVYMATLSQKKDDLPDDMSLAIYMYLNKGENYIPHYHFYAGRTPESITNFHFELSIFPLPKIKLNKVHKGEFTPRHEEILQKWLFQKSNLAHGRLGFLNWQVIVLMWNNECVNEEHQLQSFKNKCSKEVRELLEVNSNFI